MTVNNSNLIRLPDALIAELKAEADTLLEEYRRGEIDVALDTHGKVPIHEVVRTALRYLQ